MKHIPEHIFSQYRDSYIYKSSIGNKGLFEQTAINERFFIGDQWHGAKCGNERPLVRHNVIKRIGEYKISQLLGTKPKISFEAEGIPSLSNTEKDLYLENNDFSGIVTEKEINYIMSALSNYYNVTAERVKLPEINEKILCNAYISGTAVLYTYWDSTAATGLYVDEQKSISLKGDICCEVLDIADIAFGDSFCENLQNQPYIIISSEKEIEQVLREARINGANIETLKAIQDGAKNGKITVLTKLFKAYLPNGDLTVKGVKVCENAVVRKEFDTGLRLYPLSIFAWERKNGSIYGESEITYLIPNQIAINRMITANVWSAMSTGMPIMVVNGDTVTEKITNDPGQIIKIYGSNEDVEGAVKYVTPPAFTKDFDTSINTLIENTLTQSGANEVALGDSKADNAAALATMRNAALMPLEIVKSRFYTFIEDTARIWVDFWLTHYGKRNIKLKSNNTSRYIHFDSDRYKGLAICANVVIESKNAYTDSERANMLITLFEKGIINRKQLLERMPDGMVENISDLIIEAKVEE